jgi:hypothetical protein
MAMVKEVRREEGDTFFDARAIWQAYRASSQQVNYDDMLRFQRLRRYQPSWWSGFDMVGQEDKGHSLLWFIEPFRLALQGINETEQPLDTLTDISPLSQAAYANDISSFNTLSSTEQLGNDNDMTASNNHIIGEGWSGSSSLPLYLHAGESDWPSASTYTDGIQAPVDNLYDAILLGSRRIGHGIALFKHPALIELAKKNDVAVEICPISHQMLGYVDDLRNHPAQGYMAQGLQLVLASDDHGTYGYEGLSYDYYMATLAWNLGLQSIKKLVINSIKYSALDETEQGHAMESWQERCVCVCVVTSLS